MERREEGKGGEGEGGEVVHDLPFSK